MKIDLPDYSAVSPFLERLSIEPDFVENCALPWCTRPAELVSTEADYYGRPQRLTPTAFAAWSRMKTAANKDGVVLHLISAFRGYEHQFEVIKRKLDGGQELADILKVNAAPGFSEHHTGRAVDIGTLDCPALEEEFELTPAFQWLSGYGQEFGFVMTYPANNEFGITYEPWHWCFHE